MRELLRASVGFTVPMALCFACTAAEPGEDEGVNGKGDTSGAPSCTPTAWQRSVIHRSGIYPTMAVDSMGGVHISYRVFEVDDHTLSYAYRPAREDAWTIESIDPSGSAGAGDLRYTSLAVDRTGGVHVGYFKTYPADLKYAHRDSAGMWTSTVVDSTGAVGYDPSLAVDGSGRVHMSYFDGTNSALKYGTLEADGTWNTTTIDAQPGFSRYCTEDCNSLGVDAAGDVHVAYFDPAGFDLKYASRAADGTWNKTIVDSDSMVGGQPSVAVGASGEVHVSYGLTTDGWSEPLRQEVKIADISRDGSWTTDVIVSERYLGGGQSSLALDRAGGLHVAYVHHHEDGSPADLYLAHRDSDGVWTRTVVDPRGGARPSLAIDASGGVHITYGTLDGLNYAYFCP